MNDRTNDTKGRKDWSTDGWFAHADKSRHHIRCNNVENETCGHDCFTVMIGRKIVAVVPGVGPEHREIAQFIAMSLNQRSLAARIVEQCQTQE